MTVARRIGLAALGGTGWAGGSEYIRNLVRAVAAAEDSPSRPSLSILVQETMRADWQPQPGDTFDLVPVARPPRPGWWGRFQKPNRYFTKAVRQARLDFVYPLTWDNHYNLGVSLPLSDTLSPARWAAWIPDFQHQYLPEYFSEAELRKREREIPRLVADAPLVVLSSRSAEADFQRFFPEAEGKSAVLTFATFPRAEWYAPFADEDLSWLPPRFFLVSNQLWKHKNHAVVLEALRLLRGRGVKPVVIWTGGLHDFRDPKHTDLLLQNIHRWGLGSQVLVLGLVPRRTQIELMRRSLAVVQPSLFEGWSTVVEDARVLGKRLLLSEIAVHREQHPPGAEFFGPGSAEDLAGKLAAAWETLAPVPDPAAEAAARERAGRRIAEVGAAFLQIVDRVCTAR